MGLIVSESGGGGNFSILDEGSYAAVCYMLVDIGLQKNETYGNSRNKVIVGWEIPDEKVEINGKEQSRVFTNRYTASLNEKSILRRDLAAWRGRDFTPAELAEFNLRNIVGVPCLIQIIHKKGSNGKPYANLASVMGLPKGVAAPKATLEPIVYDIDESDPGDVEKLPKWIAEQVRASETYQARIAREIGGEDAYTDLSEVDGTLPF